MSHAERFARRQSIARAVRDGMTLAEAAVKFGVGVSTVSEACVENGVPSKARRPNGLGRGTYALVGDLCRTDKTLTVLAREYGVSVQRVGEVYRHCLDAGVPVRVRVQGTRQDRVE